LQQARESVEQTTHLTQGLQRLQQAFAPPARLNDMSFPTLLAHITQLSERHGVYLLKLLPRQETHFKIQINARAQFWPFVRFIQALAQLPYTIELSQVALRLAADQDETDPTANRLIGDITLENYDYE
jgi:hypothetical protein